MTSRRKFKKLYKIHPHKSILVWMDGKRKRISCDRKIVRLVRRLNKLGFTTTYSCQGDDWNDPYISFMTDGVHGIGTAKEAIRLFWKGMTIGILDFHYKNEVGFYGIKDKRRLDRYSNDRLLGFRWNEVIQPDESVRFAGRRIRRRHGN